MAIVIKPTVFTVAFAAAFAANSVCFSTALKFIFPLFNAISQLGYQSNRLGDLINMS